MREVVGLIVILLIVLIVAQGVIALEARRLSRASCPQTWHYKAQEGDSLFELAKTYYPDRDAREVVAEMYHLNLWAINTHLQPGDLLQMPKR